MLLFQFRSLEMAGWVQLNKRAKFSAHFATKSIKEQEILQHYMHSSCFMVGIVWRVTSYFEYLMTDTFFSFSCKGKPWIDGYTDGYCLCFLYLICVFYMFKALVVNNKWTSGFILQPFIHTIIIHKLTTKPYHNGHTISTWNICLANASSYYFNDMGNCLEINCAVESRLQ